MNSLNEFDKKASARKRVVDFVIAFVVAAVCALVTAFALGMFNPSHEDAYAEVYSQAEKAQSAAAADTVDSQTPDVSSPSSDESASDEEAIEDDETPMSSGLGGSEPIFNGSNFGRVAVVGIVAVVAFFLVLMRRLNGNMKDMNRMFK